MVPSFPVGRPHEWQKIGCVWRLRVEEDEEFQFIKKAKEQEVEPEEQEEELANDPRLRRLQNRIAEDVEER